MRLILLAVLGALVAAPLLALLCFATSAAGARCCHAHGHEGRRA